MPSDKKRINLTVPDDIYDKLQVYKQNNGITNDASACLQLIVQHMKYQENTKIMMNLIDKVSYEQLTQISNIGLATIKNQQDDNL